MDHFSKLTPYQQQILMQKANESQIRENSSIMINLSKACFEQCVFKFPSKILDKDESHCIENCAQRFVKSAERIALRTQMVLSEEAQQRERDKNEEK